MYIQLNGNNKVYINTAKYLILNSYTTITAIYSRKKDIIIRSDKFYSVTSSKHYNEWVRFYNISHCKVKIISDDKFEQLVSKI